MQPTEPTRTDASHRRSRLNSTVVAAGVAFGVTLAGLGAAAAQSDPDPGTTGTTAAAEAAEAPGSTPGTESAPPTQAAPPPSATPAQRHRHHHQAETELTGDTAEKVRAAAVAAVPGGTVIRVETDSDGSPYEAHVRRADGTEVVAKVDASFAVTAVEEGHRGHRGPHGPAPAALTGQTADRVTAAAQAAVPGGTVLRVHGDRDGAGYHAHVRNAEGTEVVVRLDADFDVTGTEEFTGRPGGHHGPGASRPGDAPLGSGTD